MFYSFEKFSEDIQSLIKQIRESNTNYDYVVGIKRGGLIPATCLSHALKIPLYSFTWSTRDFPYQEKHSSVLQPLSKILLVDDICDSGETLIKIKELFSFCNIDTAVLLYNEDQVHIPTYYAEKFSRLNQKEFIDFWWEIYK
jgi:hypoxanthine phosphoribosyltransferase